MNYLYMQNHILKRFLSFLQNFKIIIYDFISSVNIFTTSVNLLLSTAQKTKFENQVALQISKTDEIIKNKFSKL